MVKTKKFVLCKHFEGMPKESDFKLVIEELPELEEGEFLCEAVFFSVDPYMRAYSPNYYIGMTMIGAQIARILQSKTLKFPEGSYVVGHFGWQSLSICNPSNIIKKIFAPYIIPELPTYPLSLYLGILGMPGNTAYFGFKNACNPKPGETVVVSGAGGAVGSHVGQIAKIMGCNVIGIAGSDEKGEWLKSLGFDGFINYKTCNNFDIALSKLTPHGIDCYFDNVGGDISSIIIHHMNENGRIACCGAISGYNDSANSAPKGIIIQTSLIAKVLTIKGIHARSYTSCWSEGIRKNREWLLNGQLKYKETVTEGFENLPKAFIGMLTGKNIGKAIVKI